MRLPDTLESGEIRWGVWVDCECGFVFGDGRKREF